MKRIMKDQKDPSVGRAASRYASMPTRVRVRAQCKMRIHQAGATTEHDHPGPQQVHIITFLLLLNEKGFSLFTYHHDCGFPGSPKSVTVMKSFALKCRSSGSSDT